MKESVLNEILDGLLKDQVKAEAERDALQVRLQELENLVEQLGNIVFETTGRKE